VKNDIKNIEMKELKITIIIPLYNEEKTIIKLLKKIINLKKINFEIIVVNDGSNDDSLNLVKKFSKKNKIVLISHKKNYGKGAAIKSARKFITGNIVIIQDADLEYNPKDYFKLIKPIKENKYKVVYGSRVLNRKRYSSVGFTSMFRVFGNHVLTLISNILNLQKLTDAHTCYKVFSYEVFKRIKLEENGFEFCPEITTKISKLRLKIKEVPISYTGRKYNEGKKIKSIDAIKALIALIKYNYFR
jgi:glycosyltransferase involved in cell wall biosynthesis